MYESAWCASGSRGLSVLLLLLLGLGSFSLGSCQTGQGRLVASRQEDSWTCRWARRIPPCFRHLFLSTGLEGRPLPCSSPEVLSAPSASGLPSLPSHGAPSSLSSPVASFLNFSSSSSPFSSSVSPLPHPLLQVPFERHRRRLKVGPRPGSLLVKALRRQSQYRILLVLLNNTGLPRSLNRIGGPLTVLAPSDAAFLALGEAGLQALVTEAPLVLLFHIVVGTAYNYTQLQLLGLASAAPAPSPSSGASALGLGEAGAVGQSSLPTLYGSRSSSSSFLGLATRDNAVLLGSPPAVQLNVPDIFSSSLLSVQGIGAVLVPPSLPAFPPPPASSAGPPPPSPPPPVSSSLCKRRAPPRITHHAPALALSLAGALTGLRQRIGRACVFMVLVALLSQLKDLHFAPALGILC
eukprot:TRINITY_DN778_c0_g1_i1.p1 TRINITY_DN778_c0_g1~~TRINITY_DN778_c0_g1_i1.p1  ORF type:complete len:408 (+),score=75.71 TRINITY_DN778_c0_g1_i1:595-1818(+)